MFPVGDDRVPGGPPPLITLGLVVLNVLAFLFELSQPSGALQSFIQAWGVVPREYTQATISHRRSRCRSGARSSRRCSSTAGGCISAATCSTCGFRGQHREGDGQRAVSVVLPDLRHRRRARAHRVQRRLGRSERRRVRRDQRSARRLSAALPAKPRSRAHPRRHRRVPAIVVLGFWIVIQLISGSARSG